ncbi:retropepsin-like aspartic protease family protein [Sphingomonas nostoxanthinifaciens]|uniref:retropepsin-like aspartic protease family protein n=1 Tax=Sphingomonas nostoxanthinifaciens TaxID=2872652 RepID=UPI001CC20CD3|nr:retropepsin-like aspartic protease [Sphingomonas nostoxanthinifaciens]UAK23768.1 retropepsin-like domain-containing protein [Sphingomonas nostoxanthinifaciens]
MSFLFLALAAEALPQPDNYGPRPARGALSLAYDAEHGGQPENEAIERWLARHPTAPQAERAMLWHRLCLDYGVLVGGERRVRACRQSVDISGDSEDENDLSQAEAFRHEPPIRATGDVTAPLSRSEEGVLSIQVAANGQTSSWLVDTGAEITTVPESTAAKLGVRFEQGQARVGTITAIQVDGRLGMIDKLTLGSASVEHVPVLVLPDAMLKLRHDRVIPGILGLPILAAFHRATWLDHGSTLKLGGAAAAIGSGRTTTAVRIYWHEDGLGVPLSTPLGMRGVQLDTGSNATSLTISGLALVSPAQRAAARDETRIHAGAGGAVSAVERTLPRLDYSLAGAPLRAGDVTINRGEHGAGSIGNDAIVQLDLLAIDFDTMTMRTQAGEIE